MAAQDKVTFKQDLTEPVKIRHYEGVVFTGDDCGNIIKVALFDGGVPYSGGGTVSATAILADGTTFPLTQGVITDNMVSVPLEAGALAVSGLMGLYVKISGDGIICTVLNAIFTVQATDTGMVPAAMVTTVNELVAAIRDAQDSIPADLTNLLAAVAPTFSTATAYSAGAYVWQGGKLYRFTAAHPSGTWTGTDAVEVALGNDIADLKSALDSIANLNIFSTTGATYGKTMKDNGTTSNISTGMYTAILPVTAGHTYKLSFTYEAKQASWRTKVLGFVNGVFDTNNNPLADITCAASGGTIARDVEIPAGSGIDGVRISFFYIAAATGIEFVEYVDGSAVVTAIDSAARTTSQQALSAATELQGSAIKSSQVTMISHSTVGSYWNDVNDQPVNTAVLYTGNIVTTDVANLPVYGNSQTILYYTQKTTANSGSVQISITDTRRIYIRYRLDGTWLGWKQVANIEDIDSAVVGTYKSSGVSVSSSNYTDYFTDANDVPINQMYLVSSNVTSAMVANQPPHTGNYLLCSLAYNKNIAHGYIQMAFPQNGGMLIRSKYYVSQGVYNWTAWAEVGSTLIDNTLSIAGKAADAKTTGDAITSIQNDLTSIHAVVGGLISYSGTNTSTKGNDTLYRIDFNTDSLVEGRPLTFSLKNYTGSNFARYKIFLYDANNSYTQVYINSVGSWTDTDEHTYIIDGQKTYVRIRFAVETSAAESPNPSWQSNYSVSYDGTIQSEINGIGSDDIDGNTLAGLKIGFLGDSFTAPVAFYGAQIAARTGCTAVNYGAGGRRYYNNNEWDSGSTHYNVPAAWRTVKDMDSDLDVVVAFCGINDANARDIYETHLGTIADTPMTQTQIDGGATATSFYQGCKTTIELILGKYPDARILMVLPPHVLDASYSPTIVAYNGIEPIINAEKEIAKFYGIPTVNLFENCTELNNYSGNVARYRNASNDIHPNTAGQKAMAHYIMNALVNLVKNDFLE